MSESLTVPFVPICLWSATAGPLQDWAARTTEPADCFSALMTVAFCHLSCATLLMFQ